MKERAKFKKHDTILVAYDIKPTNFMSNYKRGLRFLGMFALMKDSITYIILIKIHCFITMKIYIQSEKIVLTQKE
jgi:hypothetical protein